MAARRFYLGPGTREYKEANPERKSELKAKAAGFFSKVGKTYGKARAFSERHDLKGKAQKAGGLGQKLAIGTFKGLQFAAEGMQRGQMARNMGLGPTPSRTRKNRKSRGKKKRAGRSRGNSGYGSFGGFQLPGF